MRSITRKAPERVLFECAGSGVRTTALAIVQPYWALSARGRRAYLLSQICTGSTRLVRCQTKKQDEPAFLFGAGSGGRTRTVLLPMDFESTSSANSNIPAMCFIYDTTLCRILQYLFFISFQQLLSDVLFSSVRFCPLCRRSFPEVL